MKIAISIAIIAILICVFTAPESDSSKYIGVKSEYGKSKNKGIKRIYGYKEMENR